MCCIVRFAGYRDGLSDAALRSGGARHGLGPRASESRCRLVPQREATGCGVREPPEANAPPVPGLADLGGGGLNVGAQLDAGVGGRAGRWGGMSFTG